MSGSVSDSWPWLSSRRSAGKPLHIGSDGQKNWSRRNASAGWTEKLNHGKCLCLSWTKQGKRESPRPVLEDWVVRFRRQVVSGTRDSVVFCGFDVSVLGVSALPNYNHRYQVDTRWIPGGYQVDTRWIPGGYQVDTTDVPFKTGTNSAGRSAQGRRRQILLRILRNILDDQLKGDMPTHILDILAWWGT